MAKRKHRHRRQPDGVLGPALRPIAWSAVIGAAIASALGTQVSAAPASPTYAEPGLPDRVPDSGARPQPAGSVQLPGASSPAAPGNPSSPGSEFLPVSPSTAGLGPLALQITAAETEVATLGEQLKQVAIERDQIRTEVTAVNAAWREALAALHTAEVAAETAAEEAYKRAAEVPPGTLHSDLQGLGALSRLQAEEAEGSEAQAMQLRRAREAEQAAYLAHEDALGRQRATETRYTGLQTTFKQREQALLDLRQRNASQLAAVEREREAQEQRLGAGFLANSSIAGLAAHADALKAVRFALAQLGEPYLWGAEGPSRWDCSGLMWAAYKSAGHGLPRVSRDQYQATKSRQVSPNALLPGDLLFFSSSKIDASKIHHVGMYIGNGRMVHAPTTGDVVKVSTVWWSRFFAATRVVRAVNAPTTPPATPPPATTPPTTPPPTTPPPTTPPPTTPPPTTPPPTTPPPTTPPPTTPPPTTPPPTTETPDPPTQTPEQPAETTDPPPASEDAEPPEPPEDPEEPAEPTGDAATASPKGSAGVADEG